MHTALAWCCYPTSLKLLVPGFHVSVENMTAISHLKWKHLLRQWDRFLIAPAFVLLYQSDPAEP